MPRDYKKTEYWIVPVDKNSELYRLILEDASETAMRSSIPVLLRIRLGEYYKMKKQQGGLTGEPTTTEQL